MNIKLIKQWVEALRNGKYSQGRKALRNGNNEFCCLGVLCDISKDILRMKWQGNSSKPEIYSIDGNSIVLPSSIYKYLGKTDEFNSDKVRISSNNLKLPDSVKQYLGLDYTYLTELNDTYKLSFNQIADIIEEEFLHEN